MTSSAELWAFLPIGYAFTVAIETPVLVAGLSRRHPVTRRLPWNTSRLSWSARVFR